GLLEGLMLKHQGECKQAAEQNCKDHGENLHGCFHKRFSGSRRTRFLHLRSHRVPPMSTSVVTILQIHRREDWRYSSFVICHSDFGVSSASAPTSGRSDPSWPEWP